MCAHVAANQATWRQDEGASLSQWLGFPAKRVLEVLDAAHSQVTNCAEQVAALGLPRTIDHGDLHGGGNAVQENGGVLIYDWETATFGCPLFSVEKLLVAAWRLDEKPEGGGPWGYVPGTPTQARVRDAYRGALGRADIAERAFAAAMCLAVVKEMHAEIAWANRMEWPNGNPEWTAQLIRRLGHHLSAMSATER